MILKSKFFLELNGFINLIKIDKDVQCRSKSTPLHYLIKSNVFDKSEYDLNNQNKYLLSRRELVRFLKNYISPREKNNALFTRNNAK